MLLAASYYFYMSWNPKLIILILITTVVSYSCARLMEYYSNQRGVCKLLLTIGVGISISILFFFKYFNFFSDSVVEILKLFSLPVSEFTINIILPVGISFYTFQTLSYVIDVYNKKIKAQSHFGIYALYVSFFPQLVAGPIERSVNLLPQFFKKHTFDYEKATYGLKMIAWGLFKKVIIADNLARYVNLVYNDISQYKGFAFILATVFFAIQIYCDFSGYSDIALGSAKLIGFDLMKNFNSPYFSKSIKEFWSRWHISLSTWFRDYVYIPLGGNRVAYSRLLFNLFATFLLSGLWHGANWTFVIWGAIHGLLLICEKIYNKFYKRNENTTNVIIDVVKICSTFVVVCFAWIFFRANDVTDALYGINSMFYGIGEPIKYVFSAFGLIGLGKVELIKLVISVSLLAVFDAVHLKTDIFKKINQWNMFSRWAVYTAIIFFIMFTLPTDNSSEFIYFQF